VILETWFLKQGLRMWKNQKEFEKPRQDHNVQCSRFFVVDNWFGGVQGIAPRILHTQFRFGLPTHSPSPSRFCFRYTLICFYRLVWNFLFYFLIWSSISFFFSLVLNELCCCHRLDSCMITVSVFSTRTITVCKLKEVHFARPILTKLLSFFFSRYINFINRRWHGYSTVNYDFRVEISWGF